MFVCTSPLVSVSSVDEGSPRNPYSFVKEDSLLALPKEVKVVVALKHRETCVKEVILLLILWKFCFNIPYALWTRRLSQHVVKYLHFVKRAIV